MSQPCCLRSTCSEGILRIQGQQPCEHRLHVSSKSPGHQLRYLSESWTSHETALSGMVQNNSNQFVAEARDLRKRLPYLKSKEFIHIQERTLDWILKQNQLCPINTTTEAWKSDTEKANLMNADFPLIIRTLVAQLPVPLVWIRHRQRLNGHTKLLYYRNPRNTIKNKTLNLKTTLPRGWLNC